MVYIIRTLTASEATFLTTSSSLFSSDQQSPGSAVNLSPTPSHTVLAALSISNVYASPSTVQHLALATHEDPVVNLESAPAVVAAVVGAGANAQVDEPPAKMAKVII